MNEKTEDTLIAIIFAILVFGSIFAGGYILMKNEKEGRIKTTSCHQSRSDLCYSLKVNRMMLEDYKEKYGMIDGMKKFEDSLTILENRNWMECEE